MLLKCYIASEIIIIVDGYIIDAEVQYKLNMSVLIFIMGSQNKNRTLVAYDQDLLHNSWQRGLRGNQRVM